MDDHLKTMKVIDLTGENQGFMHQTAAILSDSFKDVSAGRTNGWLWMKKVIDPGHVKPKELSTQV